MPSRDLVKKAEARRRWYVANKERVRDTVHRYYVANREKYRDRYQANREHRIEAARLWSLANPEKVKASARRHAALKRAFDPEKMREINRLSERRRCAKVAVKVRRAAYLAANADKIRARDRARYRANPAKKLVYQKLRRDRLKAENQNAISP